MIPDIFIQLAVALGLGLLVGLQRERVDSVIAGLRTFALITLFGAVAGQLGKTFGGWVVAVGILAVAGLMTAGNLARMQKGEAEPGQTTEIAAVLMFCVGVWVVMGSMAVAVVLGGAIALVLHLREPLHEFVGKMEERDVRGIMQFVLIALVILPVLPDRTFGPYGVLNPYQIWWMVVLIVGLSLAGYVAFSVQAVRRRGGGGARGRSRGARVEHGDDGVLCPAVQGGAGGGAARGAGRDDRVDGGVRPGAGRDRRCGPRQFPGSRAAIAVMLGVAAVLSAGMWFFGRDRQAIRPVPP